MPIVCVVAAPILLVGGSIVGEILFNKPTKPEVTKGEFPFTLGKSLKDNIK